MASNRRRRQFWRGAGLPLAVINPAQVRHYAQALGKRAKTDPIDAKVIARFAADVRPEARLFPMNSLSTSPI